MNNSSISMKILNGKNDFHQNVISANAINIQTRKEVIPGKVNKGRKKIICQEIVL